MDMLKVLYETVPGRFLLKGLIHPCLSEFSGRLLDTSLSSRLIPSFAAKNNIDLSDYEEVPYHSFNEFFCRQIKKEKRPLCQQENALISPCDGLLSAYRIHDGLVIPVKQSRYGIADLIRDTKLAKKYQNGVCLVFRLCVNHYHRYCYPADGIRSEYRRLEGLYHTVRPIALRNEPVFIENTREYTVLQTNQFGDIVLMEVGAMLVGKIVNDNPHTSVLKGMEKGHFEYGGSTIVMLLEEGKVKIPDAVFNMTKRQKELSVKMGQKIGVAH